MFSNSTEASSVFKAVLKDHSKIDSDELVKILSRVEKIQTTWNSKKMNSHDMEILNSKLQEINLESEDQLVHELRQSPRSKPRVEKFIKLNYLNEEMEVFLFDLSQGGLSFILPEPGLLKKNDVFEVLSFDNEVLKAPLKTKVVALVDFESQQRACCQFLN